VVNFNLVSTQVSEMLDHEKNFPFLSTIDIYGHTVFNGIQIERVVRELGNLADGRRREGHFTALIPA